MEIIDNRSLSGKIAFSYIKVGSIFEYGGIVHMKIFAVNNASGMTFCNAVTINAGCPKNFELDDLVTPLNCKLVIE